MEQITYLFEVDGYMVYVVIAAALLGGAVGLPIPEDLPLIFAGKTLADGSANMTFMFLICYCAIVLGDAIIFLFGYWSGQKLFTSRFFKSRFSELQVREIKKRLERHSLLMIFLARHLFYVRTLTFLTCGAFRMRISRFLIADALAALISAPLMMGIGYFSADYINAAFEVMADLKTASLYIALAILILALFFWRVSQMRQEKVNR